MFIDNMTDDEQLLKKVRKGGHNDKFCSGNGKMLFLIPEDIQKAQFCIAQKTESERYEGMSGL